MITPEQANKLIDEGILSFQRGTVGIDFSLASFLEFLICTRTLVNKAVENGNLHAPWRVTSERYRYAIEAAGVLRLGLQHHGSRQLNSFHLRRMLHPQFAEKRAPLMENEFFAKECQEAFTACFDAARTGQAYDPEAWKRFKSVLERLGVAFS